jgi:hypothetical protein
MRGHKKPVDHYPVRGRSAFLAIIKTQQLYVFSLTHQLTAVVFSGSLELLKISHGTH